MVKKQACRVDEAIWDKLIPLTFGTRVRIVRNLCFDTWGNETWFKARDLAIGKVGTLTSIRLDSSLSTQYFKFKYRIKNIGNFYDVFLQRPVLGFQNFTCIRKEIEVVKSA